MRARHQDGWVELTNAGTWKGHWHPRVMDADTGVERRTHRSRILGEKKTMRKFEAEEALDMIVGPINGTRTSLRDDRVPLAWFVEKRWRPMVEGNWGQTTAKTNNNFIGKIVAKFGDTPLRDLDAVEMQKWLNQLAKEERSNGKSYSRSMVQHCTTYLKSICREAVDQDFLGKDPGRKLRRPNTRKPDETVLQWATYQAVISAAPILRDKLAIKTGSAIAPRPGELCAFRWRSLEQMPGGRHAFRVTETVYKGKLRPWAKTLGSEDYIALPQRLATELLEWRKLTPWPEDDDFVFPNSEGGFLDYENFEARVLDPIRKKLGLEKLNFQILRRTFATRAVGEKKGSTKDVQNLFRHTRPDTALENYIKSIPTSVYNMVDAVYESILGVEKKPSQRNLSPGDKKPKNSRWSARSRRLAVMPAAGGVQ